MGRNHQDQMLRARSLCPVQSNDCQYSKQGVNRCCSQCLAVDSFLWISRIWRDYLREVEMAVEIQFSMALLNGVHYPNPMIKLV